MKATEHIEYLLRQGRNPKELIELGFLKTTVTRVHRKLGKERRIKMTEAADTEKVAVTKRRADSLMKPPANTAVPDPKLEFTESQWEQVSKLINILPELDSLMAAVEAIGIEEREVCSYYEDGVCTLAIWDSEAEIPKGSGEPIPMDEENSEWCVKPSIYYCALCTARISKRIDLLEEKTLDTPLWQARERISCNSCGSKGRIAVPIKCTNCGKETYWGWWPKPK
jgi:DNA-directed RNA polymerase subunit RPC12/RpoP